MKPKKEKMDDEMSYEKAMSEIQQILGELEEGKINMDQLQQRVKDAYSLLTFCKDRLRHIEEDLSSLKPENAKKDH